MAEPAAEPPPWLAGLNPPQLEAATRLDGAVLVLAGAGTGKTRALTARLAQILAERRAWPSQILAVTFTNKAANEMRQRLRAMLGPMVEGMPYLGTFHAIAARMLRRHAELVGLRPNFTIIDPDDGLRLLKRLIREDGIDEKRWPAKQLAALIDRWKNRALLPGDVAGDAAGGGAGDGASFADGRGAALYQRYQHELQTLNAADFGDLLLHMIRIFHAHPDVLRDWQQRFRYVLVDEYQDTNAAQYRWLTLLAAPSRGGRGNICCVGDDDQSIYSWRGAEIRNILRFEQDFPGAAIVRLEQNYRSTPHILAAAAHVIAHNAGRLGKTLWTSLKTGERLFVVGVWDGAEEARVVAERIARLLREGAAPASIAILVRAGFQTREFEERFLETALPYRIVGGFRFYERQEIRDALAYLRVLAQPADGLAFERILNVPKRGLGDKSRAIVAGVARQADMPMPEAARAAIARGLLPKAAAKALGKLVGDFTRWRALAATESQGALARLVLEESGYIASLEADPSPDAKGRLDNLDELFRAMEGFDDLEQFLEHVSLVMENDEGGPDGKITLMTLHAAKGLEFDHVFLPGWEEGLFPSQRALEEGGNAALEEERRLAYVGITRAKRRATILYAANRRIYGQWTNAIPSRFLDELPEEDIVRESTLTTGRGAWRSALAKSDVFGGAAGNAAPGNHAAAGRSESHRLRWHRQALGNSSADPGRNAHLQAGDRVFHRKFGMGTITGRHGDKLEIAFDNAGVKTVIDSFVEGK